MSGVILNEGFSYLIMMFYLCRLASYFGNQMLGVNMFQSNLSAFAIALVGMASFGSGGAASTSTILLMIDAMIGLESFRRGNTRRILNYLSVRIPGLSRL